MYSHILKKRSSFRGNVSASPQTLYLHHKRCSFMANVESLSQTLHIHYKRFSFIKNVPSSLQLFQLRHKHHHKCFTFSTNVQTSSQTLPRPKLFPISQLHAFCTFVMMGLIIHFGEHLPETFHFHHKRCTPLGCSLSTLTPRASAFVIASACSL